MSEFLIQVTAIVLTLLLAVVKSFRYSPSGISDFELRRKADAGDAQAQAEWQRRQLLPTLVSLQYLKEIIISVLIAVLLLSTHSSVVGSLLAAVYFLLAYLIAVRGWLDSVVRSLQPKIEPALSSAAKTLGPFLRFMAEKPRQEAEGDIIASRDELEFLIHADKHVLKPEEKDQLLGALHFSGLAIRDVMVPRSRIATVNITETVGPLLLDRLHKTAHHTFVAVKKDLNHIEGLVLMSDLMSGHPELKKVEDAVRPTVHYLPQNASLSAVLAASLQTGRQLFIVVGDNGNITGLISLRDVIAKLLGAAPPNESSVSTDPKKVEAL